MMQADDCWRYMVDVGNRTKPRWSRSYALRILATCKPDYVKQVWANCEAVRIPTKVDEEIAQASAILPEWRALLTESEVRPSKRGRLGRGMLNPVMRKREKK